MTMRPMATQSLYEMVSVAQAKEIISRFARPLSTETINALEARGRVLAERVVSVRICHRASIRRGWLRGSRLGWTVVS